MNGPKAVANYAFSCLSFRPHLIFWKPRDLPEIRLPKEENDSKARPSLQKIQDYYFRSLAAVQRKKGNVIPHTLLNQITTLCVRYVLDLRQPIQPAVVLYTKLLHCRGIVMWYKVHFLIHTPRQTLFLCHKNGNLTNFSITSWSKQSMNIPHIHYPDTCCYTKSLWRNRISVPLYTTLFYNLILQPQDSFQSNI